jgi:hypothetical protein
MFGSIFGGVHRSVDQARNPARARANSRNMTSENRSVYVLRHTEYELSSERKHRELNEVGVLVVLSRCQPFRP